MSCAYSYNDCLVKQNPVFYLRPPEGNGESFSKSDLLSLILKV